MIFFDGIIYSLQRHGGISVYFNELIKRSFSRDVSFHAVVHSGAAEHASLLPGNVVKRNLRLFERYRNCSIFENTNLFHSSYYRLPNRPVVTVTTVHDFTYERLVKGGRRWLHSWQKFNAIRNSHAIICISENTRNDLLYFLPEVPPDRIHVIHNGVGDAFFQLETKCESVMTRPFVMFVGARGGYKGFSFVVEVLARLPNLGLVCVGGGPLSTVEQALVNKHINGRCKHFLNISDENLNKLYNKAYCLAYPSSYEGFGIPVVEAMRAGCPVVAFNGSSIPEIAGGSALLFDQLDSSALEAAFKCLEDTEVRMKLRLKGLNQSRLFSWEKTVEQTLCVYDKVKFLLPSKKNL